MNTAVARADCSRFFHQLRGSQNRVLLVDYDGTIAPFTADRKRAVPYTNVPELLGCILSTCHTRVVVVTGRTAYEVPELLHTRPSPEIWGSHGMERLLPDGRYKVGYISDVAAHALHEAEAWLEEEGLGNVEIKVASVAVHWRGLLAAEAKEIQAAALRVLSPLAQDTGLKLMEFDGGLELRVAAPAEADAVRAVLSEVPRNVPIAYLGDDTSDESAFAALNGRGLTVLVRPEYRATCAQFWLRPPEELEQFLFDWIRSCGGDV